MSEIKNIVSVEYPGIVNDVDKALETLGGLSNIEKTYVQGTDRLELRFRPGDVYCHGVLGDKTSVNNIVVKFIRKKITKPNGEVVYKTEAKILGVIFTSYQYKTLCDFQYLPMKRIDKFDADRADQAKSAKYESIVEEAIPMEAFQTGGQTTFKPDAPLMVVPTIFSRFDTPGDYLFKSGPQHKSEHLIQEVERQKKESVIGRTRKSRALEATLLTWKDEIPSKPNPNVERQLTENDTALVSRVRAAFDSRPAWTKTGLAHELNCSRDEPKLKYALPVVAYYFSDGPYRCCWLKFGFDPKKDKSAAMYQTIDFRVRTTYKNQNATKFNITPKRSVYSNQLPVHRGDHQLT